MVERGRGGGGGVPWLHVMCNGSSNSPSSPTSSYKERKRKGVNDKYMVTLISRWLH